MLLTARGPTFVAFRISMESTSKPSDEMGGEGCSQESLMVSIETHSFA